jgi:D-glycero-D-manno-heptose 1,7-bisphosphate phosphatase
MNRAVFLDRDGTLNVETEYLHKPEDVVLYPQAGPALRSLCDAGFKLVIVTNQSGIGRGYYTVADMESVNAHLISELDKMGARIDRIYFAPEAPDQPSRGRKPSPQFLFDARDEMGIDLAQSYMIGDKLIDLECGWNAGVNKSILVRTGYGADYEKKNPGLAEKAWIVNDLAEAAEKICDSKISI